MSPYFIDNTPILEMVLRNPFMNKVFPAEGSVMAILDTGFEGFLLVPKDVFQELSLNKLKIDRRSLILANGLSTQSTGTFSEVFIPRLGIKLEGFVETMGGVSEIVAGTSFMENLRLLVDYCTRRIEVESCSHIIDTTINNIPYHPTTVLSQP
ncbi:MAG: clan AA aspartic protease [Thermoproteota archaeon]